MAPQINLASFGNMTPHVHWHVIPRLPTMPISQPTWAGTACCRSCRAGGRRALLPALHEAMIERLQGIA
jgi:diadenosine tetraphosphate (Ap4A) HIT family hydrolase